MISSVLLVDRDPELADAVRRTLTSHGHAVRTCVSGLQCMETLREFAPMVLVLDPEVLCGGGEDILEWLSREQAMLPPMVVLASERHGKLVPDRLESMIDVRIPRPQSTEDRRASDRDFGLVVGVGRSTSRDNAAEKHHVRTLSADGDQCGRRRVSSQRF